MLASTIMNRASLQVEMAECNVWGNSREREERSKSRMNEGRMNGED